KSQETGNIVPLNIHEYIHTQQKGEPENLLGQAIKEGACDFITELVVGRPLQNHYLQYGRAHENELKEAFKLELFTAAYGNWLYNGSSAKTVADLGYFMGYAICQAYYRNAPDQQKAVQEIIELNYSDTAAVEGFLERSGYYGEPLHKNELIRLYESRRPFVVRLEPFAQGDTGVDASVKELRIVFSEPMQAGSFSLSYGKRGKDYNPIAGIGGFSEDGLSFTLKLDLKPGREYEFRITDRSFRSARGYALKPLEVSFRTR
ncbi:MAG TPA: Ig-like domain-containing protein, partial [Chitinophagaceae bacterium]|nr:Ig-like domain-containing protein [Chitinophagaceae bacterium]